jgi:hypothetical protein
MEPGLDTRDWYLIDHVFTFSDSVAREKNNTWHFLSSFIIIVSDDLSFLSFEQLKKLLKRQAALSRCFDMLQTVQNHYV